MRACRMSYAAEGRKRAVLLGAQDSGPICERWRGADGVDAR